MIETVKYTLANGLRVVHNYDPTTVMVAVDVLYNVGARDENPALTGIAHLFEHLMFGGSKNVPDFDVEIENAGGSDNAWTSNDFTNFFDIVPAQNAETVFHLESDRMLALNFDEKIRKVQQGVVIEEFKQQCLNRPFGDIMHHLRPMIYTKGHPYSWPVIGVTPEHVAKVTDEDIKQWFYAHYAPNNAVMAISGNLTPEKGREMVERWFGDIPRREIPPRNLPEPRFLTQDSYKEVTGAVPFTQVAVAIPMAAYGTHDYLVADVITDLLSAGRSSRIFRNVLTSGQKLVTEADASIAGCEHPGFMLFNIRPSGQSTAEALQATNLVLNELEKLARPGEVTPHELERSLNRFESTFYLGNLDALSKAQNLALAEMHGEDINRTVERQRTVTLGDIQRLAAELILSPKATLLYRKG